MKGHDQTTNKWQRRFTNTPSQRRLQRNWIINRKYAMYINSLTCTGTFGNDSAQSHTFNKTTSRMNKQQKIPQHTPTIMPISRAGLSLGLRKEVVVTNVGWTAGTSPVVSSISKIMANIYLIVWDNLGWPQLLAVLEIQSVHNLVQQVLPEKQQPSVHPKRYHKNIKYQYLNFYWKTVGHTCCGCVGGVYGGGPSYGGGTLLLLVSISTQKKQAQ